MSRLSGKAQTVLGLIDPRELGVTLMHDHVLVDLTALVPEPRGPRELELARRPVTLENLGWLRFHPYQNYDNMKLDNKEELLEELLEYKALGGNTIVDPAPPEIGRDPAGLARMSRLTGLNIVCGTSHYVHHVHSSDMSGKSVKDITREFVKEIEQGIGDTGIRAGIIGELGNSWPWHDNEKKCCMAAVRAQQETGATITVHPGRTREAPFEIIRLLKKQGADLERVIMGHIENRVFETKGLEEIADQGCAIEFDAFGTEHFPFGENPSDEDRVKLLCEMIEDGYEDRILVSHDICRKFQLKRYGGFGYGHILENIAPLFRKEGVLEEDLLQLLIKNPERLLTLA